MKITVKNCSLTLKKESILRNINLSLEPGKLIMLLGNNGAGKTQLIKTLMGFQRPAGGNILYGEQDLNSLPYRQRAKLISYVPQSDEPDVHFSVEDFIVMGFLPSLNFYAGPTAEMCEKVPLVMEQLGISHLRRKFTDELSGGEYRLCYLARAIIQETPWLIMDEPTGSLDFAKEHQFLNLIRQTVVKGNKGVLMSIHSPLMAYDYGDILILMKEGQILDIIPMDENKAHESLEKGLKLLYGNNIGFEDTKQGKVLVWKEI